MWIAEGWVELSGDEPVHGLLSQEVHPIWEHLAAATVWWQSKQLTAFSDDVTRVIAEPHNALWNEVNGQQDIVDWVWMSTLVSLKDPSRD